MILNIHSDALYLLEPRVIRRLAGYFLQRYTKKMWDNHMNGNIFVLCGILHIMVCSSTEAELGALLLYIKKGKFCTWPFINWATNIYQQQYTLTTAQYHTLQMRAQKTEIILDINTFFLVTDQVTNKEFNMQWHSPKENLSDYCTKLCW